MEKLWASNFSASSADLLALGIPLGKNSEKVLRFLRKTSLFFETFDVDKRRGLKLRICDLGNLKFKKPRQITEKIREIVRKGKVPLILSKSHLASFFSIQAFEKELKIVIFDAHADLRNEYWDEKVKDSVYPLNFEKKNSSYNCATWLRRLIEKGYKNVVLVGLRACSEDELEFLETNKILYFTSRAIKKDLKDVRKKLEKFARSSKLYVSLDMDVFDPPIAPAVDHPEPNGLNFQEFSELVEGIARGKFVGLDLAEICLTEKKLMEITSFLALKALFEILLRIRPNL